MAKKYIDAEQLKKRIIGYGIVHEGDLIPIPFYKEHCAKMVTELLRWICEEVDDTPTVEISDIITSDNEYMGSVVQGRWIPVTERLPEEQGAYLVTVNDGGIRVAIAQWWYNYLDHAEGYFVCDDCYAEDIVAWMPLPTHYKGGEEE